MVVQTRIVLVLSPMKVGLLLPPERKVNAVLYCFGFVPSLVSSFVRHVKWLLVAKTDVTRKMSVSFVASPKGAEGVDEGPGAVELSAELNEWLS